MSVPPSPQSDTLEIAYLERLRDEYGSPPAQPTLPDLTPTVNKSLHPNPTHDPTQDVAEIEGEEYEFRLFSRPSAVDTANSTNVQRIAIRSPTPPNGDPGFVIPQRPRAYYFTGDLDALRKERVDTAAVSGEEILAGLETKWPGCYLPWRVSIIKSSLSKCDSNVKILGSTMIAAGSNGKKRKGKKRRIAIRTKIQAAQQSREERDRAGKEKKTRINRGKKVRRKLKDKAKKLEQGTDVPGVG